MVLEAMMMDERREARAEGRDEGREEGRDEGRRFTEIMIIAKNYRRGVAAQAVSDITDIDIAYVKQVYSLMGEHPKWNEEELYDYIMEDEDSF